MGEEVVDTRLNEELEAILSAIRANRNILITKVDKEIDLIKCVISNTRMRTLVVCHSNKEVTELASWAHKNSFRHIEVTSYLELRSFLNKRLAFELIILNSCYSINSNTKIEQYVSTLFERNGSAIRVGITKESRFEHGGEIDKYFRSNTSGHVAEQQWPNIHTLHYFISPNDELINKWVKDYSLSRVEAHKLREQTSYIDTIDQAIQSVFSNEYLDYIGMVVFANASYQKAKLDSILHDYFSTRYSKQREWSNLCDISVILNPKENQPLQHSINIAVLMNHEENLARFLSLLSVGYFQLYSELILIDFTGDPRPENVKHWLYTGIQEFKGGAQRLYEYNFVLYDNIALSNCVLQGIIEKREFEDSNHTKVENVVNTKDDEARQIIDRATKLAEEHKLCFKASSCIRDRISDARFELEEIFGLTPPYSTDSQVYSLALCLIRLNDAKAMTEIFNLLEECLKSYTDCRLSIEELRDKLEEQLATDLVDEYILKYFVCPEKSINTLISDKAAHVVELERAEENLKVVLNNIKAGG